MDASLVSTLPYNNKNVLVSFDDVSKLLGQDLTPLVKDINLYRKAFVHKSYCTRKNENFINGNVNCPEDCLPLQDESNERLEFLGDAVLSIVVARYLFERFPDENEGYLTKMRTKLVNGLMLAHLASLINLGSLLTISKQIEESGGRENKKLLEDCFEAFIGAIFLDTDFATVDTWITTLIEKRIDFSALICSNHNYKDIMLKHYQHTYGYVPRFFETKIENNSRTGGTGGKVKIYHVCAKDQKDQVIGRGKGPTKKQAENDCAKNLMENNNGMI